MGLVFATPRRAELVSLYNHVPGRRGFSDLQPEFVAVRGLPGKLGRSELDEY